MEKNINKEMIKTINLNIDGRKVSVNDGTTILQAAQKADIYIPTLCYHPNLTPYGGCRLCIVEVENMRGYPTSCTTPAAEGMIVRTNTEKARELRKGILELILSEHPHTCLICDRLERCRPFDICLRNVAVTERCVICPKNGRCELQKLVDYLEIEHKDIADYKYKSLPVLTDSPFFDRDYNLCVLCGRCVGICQEVRGAGAIAFTYRGSQSSVGTAFEKPLVDVGCQFCGACVDICPTGALMEKATKWESSAQKTVKTICPYCGVGCQLKLEVKDGKILNSVPDVNGPANKGQACVKGRFGIAEMVNSPDRLKKPLIRRNGKLEETSWDEALDYVALKLSQYKGEQFAFVASAKCTNEDNYVMQKFTRVVQGTNNIDHCARL